MGRNCVGRFDRRRDIFRSSNSWKLALLSSSASCSCRNAEFLLGDIGEGGRKPEGFRVEEAKAMAHQHAAERLHRLLNEVPGAAWIVANVDLLPASAANRTAIEFSRGGMAVLAAPEYPIGAILLLAGQGRLLDLGQV
jgi:hypothetical protein